jgi:cell division protein FtsW
MLSVFQSFKEDEKVLFSISAIILCLGLLMVYSSSYIFAVEVYGQSSYFFFRQIINAFVGVIIFLVVSNTKFEFWIKYAPQISLFSFLLIVLTFMPVIGVSVKGSSRWINLIFVQFQPGELLKFTTILMGSHFVLKYKQMDGKTLVKELAILFAPIFLLALQPDFGTFIICLLIVIFLGFISDFPRKIFYSLFFSGTILGTFVLTLADYRVQRMLTFLDPWKHPRSSGFQIIQSYLAFSSGGWFGLGIGNSNEKLLYLPEAHNDFIFSVVGEEFGFLGVAVIVSLFICFIFYGFKIAISFKRESSQLVVSGVIFLIGLQAMFNMGVVLGLLPTKGLNLPFFSYGGSSLICNFFGLGLIVSGLKKKYEENAPL